MTHGTDHRVDPWQVPEVEALASLRHRRPALTQRYTLRHLALLVALTPLVLWWFRESLPPGMELDAGWWAALALAALLGAAALVTYLPAPAAGVRRVTGAPCGAMAGVLVVLAALSLGGAVPSVLSALPAVVLAGAALATRVTTAASCR